MCCVLSCLVSSRHVSSRLVMSCLVCCVVLCLVLLCCCFVVVYVLFVNGMKFLDLFPNELSRKHLPLMFFIDQERRWSKTIRYRCSLYHKPCRLEIGVVSSMTPSAPLRYQRAWVLGGVWSQGWNLRALTERHHQEWSLRLNLTQHGKTHQVQTQ